MYALLCAYTEVESFFKMIEYWDAPECALADSGNIQRQKLKHLE